MSQYATPETAVSGQGTLEYNSEAQVVASTRTVGTESQFCYAFPYVFTATPAKGWRFSHFDVTSVVDFTQWDSVGGSPHNRQYVREDRFESNPAACVSTFDNETSPEVFSALFVGQWGYVETAPDTIPVQVIGIVVSFRITAVFVEVLTTAFTVSVKPGPNAHGLANHGEVAYNWMRPDGTVEEGVFSDAKTFGLRQNATLYLMGRRPLNGCAWRGFSVEGELKPDWRLMFIGDGTTSSVSVAGWYGCGKVLRDDERGGAVLRDDRRGGDILT